jgi:hypothetical protein
LAASEAMRFRSSGEIFSIRAFADFRPIREKYALSFLSFMPSSYMLNG